MRAKHPKLALPATVCTMVLLFAVFYSAIAFPVFQWRNPKANEMTFYSEFGNVITFQRMEKYQ